MGEKPNRASPIHRYRDLLIYQQAYRLALDVSRLSKAFPRHEQYELGRQIPASARSIAVKIVEGWAKRESAAEFRRHLQIAAGEWEETRFGLEPAVDDGCAPKEAAKLLEAEYAKLGMMIHNLWKEWRKLS
jgi:four helix bundle protein